MHYPTEDYKDQYMVGLVVFHQLHCVSNLRRALYPKRYNSSLVDEDGNVDYDKWHHLDHCLDQLRTYLECHPEMTAMPFFTADESINLVYPLTTRKYLLVHKIRMSVTWHVIRGQTTFSTMMLMSN